MVAFPVVARCRIFWFSSLSNLAVDNSFRRKVVNDTNTQAKTIKPIIKQLVKEGSIVVTDEWQAYRDLAKNYQHVVVNHKEGKYVCGSYGTKRIKGYWSIFKRGIYGIYHQVSAKHLHRYCDEFSFRYNSREVDVMERFASSLQTSQRRLTYHD